MGNALGFATPEDADRLFVPMNTDPWTWFRDGIKTWELRRMRGQFTTKHVRTGRRVELRRGYSTPDSLWGTIAEYRVFDSIHAAIYALGVQIIPYEIAHNRVEAVKHATKILGDEPGQFIAFRPVFDTSPKSDNGES